MVVDNTTPQYIRQVEMVLLTQFAKLVGKEKTLEQTQKIRISEELEMDKVITEMAKGAQLRMIGASGKCKCHDVSAMCARRKNELPHNVQLTIALN